MPRPVHFDIQADDPQRAMKFYQELFGWEFQEYMADVYWLITTGDENSRG